MAGSPGPLVVERVPLPPDVRAALEKAARPSSWRGFREGAAIMAVLFAAFLLLVRLVSGTWAPPAVWPAGALLCLVAGGLTALPVRSSARAARRDLADGVYVRAVGPFGLGAEKDEYNTISRWLLVEGHIFGLEQRQYDHLGRFWVPGGEPVAGAQHVVRAAAAYLPHSGVLLELRDPEGAIVRRHWGYVPEARHSLLAGETGPDAAGS